jgi:hypothetical protein
MAENSDLPTPRFRIGQVVFLGDTTDQMEAHPCPDCLGSREWTVTTPGGSTLVAPCQRCDSRWTSSDLPSLSYSIKAPTVRSLTIGSVRIETDQMPNERVAYMCVETGIGSGSIYYEHRLSATHEMALAHATATAALANGSRAATPERMAIARLSNLTIESAVIKNAGSSIWNAWWAYRRLREDVDGCIKEMPEGDDRRALEDISAWERDHRRNTPELGQLLERVDSACNSGSIDGLRAWREEFSDLAALAPVKELAGEPL